MWGAFGPPTSRSAPAAARRLTTIASPARPGTATSSFRSTRPGPALLLAFAFLLPVVFSNRVFLWFLVPKAALCLVALGPGVVALTRLAWRRERAAMFGAGFLLLAGLATATAVEPTMSLLGEYFSLNGLLFVAVGVGVWALGAWYGTGLADRLVTVLVAGAAVNALVAWLQESVDLGLAPLASSSGRAQGLMGNPVYLAGFLVGALWLVWWREARAERRLGWWVLSGVLVGALQLTGSRVGVGAAMLVLLGFAGGHVRKGAARRAIAFVLVAFAGLALSLLPAGAHGSTSQRMSGGDTAGGLRPRVLVWGAAIAALPDRPLLGYGPGRFQTATSGRRSLEVVRYQGADVLFSDAHNFFVEVLTTTGLLGFLAFLAWLLAIARRARGPLVGFAVLAAATMLLQPESLALTPLVLLALGVAGAPSTERVVVAGAARTVAALMSAVLAIGGAAAGVRLLRADTAFATARRTESLRDAARAVAQLPSWPQPEGLRAALLDRRAQIAHSIARGRSALVAERRALARDPQDPAWWSATGELEERWGSLTAADAAYRHALSLDPWSSVALLGRYRVALTRAEHDTAVDVRRRLCAVGPTSCPPRSSLTAPAPDTSPTTDGR